MPVLEAEQDNLTRWNQSQKGFEVYYLKWNDLRAEAAGWLRYTLLAAPAREPETSLWGFFFDVKNPKNNRALKRTIPAREARIEREIFYFAIQSSAIFQTGARGTLKSANDQMSWELKLEEPTFSLRHLPPLLYHLPWPRTKLLAPHLSCRVSGEFLMNDRRLLLNSVPAHQAHLWGTRQADSWVWGNCNTFREDAGALFEGLTAQVRAGKKLLRPATLLFFRYRGKNYSFLSPLSWLQNRSHHETCRWHFEAGRGDIRFVGNFSTEPDRMIGMQQQDPIGAIHYGHHTMVADLKIEVFQKRGDWKLIETLTAEKSAAFEVVGEKKDSRVPFLL